MKYIGFYMGHDATVVALNEAGEIIFYGQVERYNRKKNHAFDLEPIGATFPNLPQAEKDDIVVCVATENLYDPKWRSVFNVSAENSEYDDRLVRRFKPYDVNKNLYKKFVGKNPDYEIHHHLGHALAAWCYRKTNEEKLFVCYDGAGMDAKHYMTNYLVGRIGPNGFSMINDATPIPTSIPLVGLLGYNSAGKSMGMAGYMPKREWTDDHTLQLSRLWLSDKYEPCYPYFPHESIEELTEDKMQFVADFYRWYTSRIWKTVEDNINRFSTGGVAIGGGTTLALEINSKIYDMTKEVAFAPPTDDSGVALGAAAFAYYQVHKKWITVNTASLNELQDALPEIGPQDPDVIAKLIASGKVVGLLRGKGEAGPRALGFRSILATAEKDNLYRVSQQIKGREFYRPLAPLVTAEQFDRFFVGPKGEYMQYLVHCTEEAQELLPAICHRDNTARPQVVYKEKDPWLHKLLVTFGDITGVECMINTSLNKRKKPICNTYEDAKSDMRGKDIELVSIATDAWTLPKEKPKILI